MKEARHVFEGCHYSGYPVQTDMQELTFMLVEVFDDRAEHLGLPEAFESPDHEMAVNDVTRLVDHDWC